MKLLLDINIILDVLLERTPWAEEAAQLLAATERGQVEAFVSGHTITTAHYVVAKVRGRKHAAAAVTDLLRILQVVPVEKADFHQALVLNTPDFEDALQAACALKIGADALVTRNEKHFRDLPIPVQFPGAVLAKLQPREPPPKRRPSSK